MHPRTTLDAKRAKKVDREAAWAEKKAREAQDKKRRKGRATDITPAAVVANVSAQSSTHIPPPLMAPMYDSETDSESYESLLETD